MTDHPNTKFKKRIIHREIPQFNPTSWDIKNDIRNSKK